MIGSQKVKDLEMALVTKNLVEYAIATLGKIDIESNEADEAYDYLKDALVDIERVISYIEAVNNDSK